MKRLEIENCSQCKHCQPGRDAGYFRCPYSPTPARDMRLSSEFPEWCPLPEVEQPEVEVEDGR